MTLMWRRGGPWRMLLSSMFLALCGCTAPLVEAQPAASPVRAITLERQCMGCPGAMRLVLRADGSAVLTQIGNARRGTEDKTLRGSVAPREFDQLARFAETQGFFQMREAYQDDAVQDGTVTLITVTRGNTDKQVLRRENAGPEALKALEAAIDAVKDRIAFKAERP